MPFLDCPPSSFSFGDLMSAPRCLQHVYQCLCTFLSLLLNGFLAFLILKKSPKKLGDYKYLMLYTTVFEAIYTMVDLVTEPTSYSHGYAFVVFRRYNDSWTTSTESQLLTLSWCGLFGASMAVFGVHFVYRFAAIHHSHGQPSKLQLIGRNVSYLCSIPVVYGIWWTVVCVLNCRFSPETSPETYDYMRSITKSLYNLDIEHISYISAVFYITDPITGSLSLNFRTWIAMFQFSLMVGSSMFCVFYLGAKCYLEISNQLSHTSAVSQVASALQTQLFFALVGQTLIPVAVMYIPICIFCFCPMFIIDIGVISTFLTHTVTLYPVLDPLPNMLIIKSYRNAIKDLWKRFKRTAHLTSQANHLDTVTSVHSTMKHFQNSLMI